MTVHFTDEAREKIFPRRDHGPSTGEAMPRKKLIEEVEKAASEKPGTGSEANSVTYRWGELRRALAVASQADFDAALAAARALWPKQTDLLPRCALAYAFPSESDWANVAAQAMVDQIKKQKGKIAPYEAGIAMLGATASPELQAALAKAAAAKRLAIYSLTEQIMTMVDLTGEAATPGIAALLATAPSNDHKVGYASALALIESDDAAHAIASALSSKVVLPIAREYFQKYPTLAKTALARVAKSSTTAAPIAAQLLKGV
jgi:hypothetical protein